MTAGLRIHPANQPSNDKQAKVSEHQMMITFETGVSIFLLYIFKRQLFNLLLTVNRNAADPLQALEVYVKG